MLSTARRMVLAGSLAMAVVAMALAGLMMLTISYDVLVRYAFAAPTDWAYPLNSGAVLGLTVLAMPYLYATGHHISMDLVHRALSPRWQRVAGVVTAVATALFGLVLAVTGFQSVALSYSHGLTGAGTFSVPLWIPDAVLAVSGTFLVLVALLFPPGGEPDPTASGPSAQDGANP
ncbi:TRAP transporter small permease [Saccharopolyspora sp. K220]|uniref:TRAP transporter small permease n=1 Tax=Saccharopolyspora soli TaxID=2926618 RepID=UPI001F5A55E8|nr:TRAP transporter small permease [Saccharopolyspora soli]MCI2416844.1 TRAP transporter small permease [Saccharopolyspora soli]